MGYSIARMTPEPQLWTLMILDINLKNLQSVGLIFDSGTSYILTPTNDIRVVLDYIKRNKDTCTLANDSVISCPCTANTLLD